MSNLIEQYDTGWFINKFGGSYFMHEGVPHVVSVDSGSRWRTSVPCLRLERATDGAVTPRNVSVHADTFTDVGVFSVPNLGWRSDDKGKFLAYFQRNNSSYHRGLADRNLGIVESSMTQWLRIYGGYSRRLNNFDKAMLALMPEFLPMTEGIAKIRAGDLLTFAVSPTIAVVPDIDDKLSIMFKTKVAGTVMPDNTLSFHIPEISSYMENS